MKFKIFETMSKAEAQKYLREFLNFGAYSGIDILRDNLHFTVDLDFSIESLTIVLRGLIPNLRTLPRAPDPNVPEFIRQTEDYKKGLFDYDEPSKLIVLAAAYYLGQTFVQNFKELEWATGNTDFLQGNMPVVRLFEHEVEMAPIMVMENLLNRVISGMGESASIEVAIKAWVESVPD